MNQSNIPDRHAKEELLSVPGLADHFQKGARTGCIYNLNAGSVPYDDNYFLVEYEKQYHKSYLEDEAKLRQIALRRLVAIQKLKAPPASLLEIGCATGFFLDEARNAGYQVQGIEISEYAAQYAQSRLKLDVSQVSFMDSPDTRFDIICAAYSLEHIAEQASLFAKISRMLNAGGTVFFALPSYHGPLFDFQRDEWQKTHPEDHFADYSPASLKKSLALYDIELQQCWPASYHQERCLGWLRRMPEVFYKIHSNIRCYGDTMEGLACKAQV